MNINDNIKNRLKKLENITIIIFNCRPLHRAKVDWLYKSLLESITDNFVPNEILMKSFKE